MARHADLIHTHGDVASVIALPLLRARPAVMTCQGLHMLRRVQGAGRPIMLRGIAAVVQRCGAVICSSQDERDDLARFIRDCDRPKLHVVLNGVDAPAAVDEGARDALRRMLGVGPGTVLGLFVGQLEERKAPLLAARAATRALAAGAPFVLAVAGDGPLAPELQALAGGAVLALGYRSDVSRLLAAADVYVHPSEREGMSFALIEAMSHGLAVVAADSSSNPEAVGDAGVLFAPGDPEAMAAALVSLSSDRALRATLGAKAAARARDQFSTAAFLARTEPAYQQALARATAPGLTAAARPA
jgi:glycosyltransferase involved in cell wall biosynthesis